MASLLPNVPLQYMNPRMKYALMNYLVGLGLPARVMREVLQQWGEAMGVQIDPSDYEMLNQHLRTTAGPNAPRAGG